MDRLTKVEFTNLEKILYPKIGATKLQVIEYYVKIAPRMLAFLAERPIVIVRFPDGLGKEGFYEKDAPIGSPSWIKTFQIYSKTARRNINYVLCNNLDTLVWIANLATLEINVMLSRLDAYESPDLVFFDIDPEPPAGFDDAVEIALLLKEKLDLLDLISYVKTSGKKGIHVVVPVVRAYTYRQTREFVHQIGKSLVKESEIVVSEFSESRDPGKVFIDYLQNSHGRTMICPYSLRAVEQAVVSTPLEWRDIKKGLKPQDFNLFNLATTRKNPWELLLENRQKLEAK